MRRLECADNPVYRVHYDDVKKEVNPKGEGARNTCVVCKKQTIVFCTSCRVWLCGPHVERLDHITEKNVVVCLKFGEVYSYNTCWHSWQKPGLGKCSE